MFTAVTEMLTFVAFANIVQLYLFSVIISFFFVIRQFISTKLPFPSYLFNIFCYTINHQIGIPRSLSSVHLVNSRNIAVVLDRQNSFIQITIKKKKKTRETGYCLVENKKCITIIPKQCLFFIIHTKLQLGIQMFFLKPK